MRGTIFQLFSYIQEPTPGAGLFLAMQFFSIIAIVLVLLPFHECAHGLSAKWLGDETAKRSGRLTLNPLAHIDPLGTICMFLIGFGWAKPVPVNPLCANRRVTMRSFMALTAAAGPASNVLFSLVCVIISKIIYVIIVPAEFVEKLASYDTFDKFYALSFMFSEYVATPFLAYLGFALMMMATTSIYLAVFNLLPIPPLDGSKMLFFFLNNRQIDFIERHMNIVRTILLILLLTTGIITGFIGFLGDFILKAIEYATFFIG